MRRERALGQVQLPRDAETIIDPTEAAAESVLAERHERRAAFEQLSVEGLELLLRVAVDEHRERRREAEAVLDRAIDADDGLPADRERSTHHGSFGPGLSGAV